MRTLILCLIASLAVAALAFADEQRKTDKRGDLKGVSGDAKGFDFRSASVAHAGPDTYRHRVTSWNADAKGMPSVVLEIGTGGSRPSHFVQKPRGKKAGVYMYTRRGAKRVAGAKFKRHSSKSFSLTFNIGFAGLPEEYRWRWVIPNPDTFKPIDKLPNRGMVTHDVSTGHD